MAGPSVYTVSQATVFALTTNGTGGAFYNSSSATTVITSATMAAGTSFFTVYYKQTSSSTSLVNLTAARVSGNAIPSASLFLNVTAVAQAAARATGVICSATTGNGVSRTLDLTSSSYTNCAATAGTLLLMVYGHDTESGNVLPAVPDPSGWTLLSSVDSGTTGTSNQLRSKIYYRISTGNDVSPSFTATNSGSKMRQTFVVVGIMRPNATTPIANYTVTSGAAPTTGTIVIPAITTTARLQSTVSWIIQNTGGNNYTPEAGLAPVAVAGSGGQAITMGVWSKDLTTSGYSKSYSVGTSQAANAYSAGQILANPT